MGSLEKYYSLGPLLVKIEELSFGTSTGKCPGLRTYYEYWTNRVYNALVVMIGTALKDFSILLRGVNTQSERDSAKEIASISEIDTHPFSTQSQSLVARDYRYTFSLVNSQHAQ